MTIHAAAVLTAFWVVASACAPPRSPAESGRNTAGDDRALARVDAQKVDALAASTMKSHAIPGMSIAVVRRGHLAYSQSFGLANLEHSIAVTPRSPFKIASLTKPVTAISILQLVEAGRVSLDQPVSRYVSDLPDQWRRTTVRQLLGHTSGLPDYLRSPAWSWKHSWRLDLSHAEVVQMTAQAPIVFEPGRRMQYCNTNYYLLGMVIEAVSGQTYAEYVKEHLFRRLGMSDSRLDAAAAIIPGRVSGYTSQEGVLHNTEFTSDTWAFAEGGLLTTAEDLARLDAALYGDALIGKPSIDLMWTPTTLADGSVGVIGDNGAGQPNHYGLGWFISHYKGHRLFLAGGNKPGFSCTYFRFVDANLTVIVLSNLSSSPVYRLAGEIAETFLGR